VVPGEIEVAWRAGAGALVAALAKEGQFCGRGTLAGLGDATVVDPGAGGPGRRAHQDTIDLQTARPLGADRVIISGKVQDAARRFDLGPGELTAVEASPGLDRPVAPEWVIVDETQAEGGNRSHYRLWRGGRLSVAGAGSNDPGHEHRECPGFTEALLTYEPDHYSKTGQIFSTDSRFH